jgi:hypothetical protein
VKYVACLKHAWEVSLLGTAHLEYWRRRLQPEALRPIETEGLAQVLVVGVRGRYRGVRFSELSFSILVARPDDAPGGKDAAYLVHAFNSNRFFAFCERTFFATPYHHGAVKISTLPDSIVVATGGKIVFHAARHAPAGDLSDHAASAEGFEGPVYLPSPAAAPNALRRFFVARIGGDAQVFPFSPERDTLTLAAEPGDQAIGSLIDSGFAARQWVLRPDATHAKSKTHRRAMPAIAPAGSH